MKLSKSFKLLGCSLESWIFRSQLFDSGQLHLEPDETTPCFHLHVWLRWWFSRFFGSTFFHLSSMMGRIDVKYINLVHLTSPLSSKSFRCRFSGKFKVGPYACPLEQVGLTGTTKFESFTVFMVTAVSNVCSSLPNFCSMLSVLADCLSNISRRLGESPGSRSKFTGFFFQRPFEDFFKVPRSTLR